MPGIVTHSKIFKDSVALLGSRKKKSYLLRPLAALLRSPENFTAGLFGSLGPNIFDYCPSSRKKAPFGSDLSFALHNGGSHAFIESMTHQVLSWDDRNTPWAALQRAYLYGFISHVVADAVFHPFVFYFSGFPDSPSDSERRLYREQNLLFQYNMDNYYLYLAEDRAVFSLDEMLPLVARGRMRRLNPVIANFILECLADGNPGARESLALPLAGSPGRGRPALSMLDLAPFCIRAVYRLKMTRSPRVLSLARDLRRRRLLYSDHLVCYPEKKSINRHVLNLHSERWQYPAERPGVLYDSVDSLARTSCEKTVALWEKIEAGLFGGADLSALQELRVNAYTGVSGAGYFSMINKSPVRLRS
jgi:hypothetical protein